LEGKAVGGWGEAEVGLSSGEGAEGNAGGNVEKRVEVVGNRGGSVLCEEGGELAKVFAA
jgi:hypothetical protein